jgi:histidine kinase
MPTDPSGYRRLVRVHQSSTTTVYRAERERDGCPVVLKILEREAATPQAVARYRHEYELLQGLRLPGVITVLDLTIPDGRDGAAMLVLEDFGAESLARLHRMQRFDGARVLDLAIRVAGILDRLHESGIIHRDINPSNILLAADTDTLKLADFGWSIRVAGESVTAEPGMEGTLAYLSPEQTGRTSRRVDCRTDFYALGVTLYELFSGRRPFDTDDPLELVHSHLARDPVRLHDIDPGIPEAISDIVMKLMAKMPEDRYQSARGCAADLRTCQAELESSGRIRRFALGQQDHVERLRIGSRLYGREGERETLLASMASAMAGARALVLLTGAPGTGKSALVETLALPSARGGAHFIAGKFDPHRRSVPYAALAQAFGALVGQLVTEPEARLAHWRDALRDALGPGGQVLLEVIPELAFLVEPQPDVTRPGPAENEKRFQLVFQRFLEALCTADHPLVVFLDDLQWADAASVRLLRQVLSHPDLGHLLVIGAHREGDAESDTAQPPATPLDQLLGEVNAGFEVRRIALGPLGGDVVQTLLADTLQRSPDDCAALAELVLARTEGNPFFIAQFLGALQQEGLLVFDRGLRGWRWDLDAIQARGITDDVVELMVDRMRRLPAASRRALELAACLGSEFDIDTLAILSGDTAIAVHGHLVPAMELGLVQPVSAPQARPQDSGAPALVVGRHAFAHERVREAAYALLPTGERAGAHLRGARLLEGGLPAEERERRIFELAEHYVLGAALIDDPTEQRAVARLCLAAGQRAQQSLARERALRFLRAGLSLMPAANWDACYELMRDLALAAIEAAYLDADYDLARRLSEDVHRHARELLDRVAVYELQLRFHSAQGQLDAGLAAALEALALLGIDLSREPEALLAYERDARVGERR